MRRKNRAYWPTPPKVTGWMENGRDEGREERRLENSPGCDLVARTSRSPSGTVEGEIGLADAEVQPEVQVKRNPMRTVEAEQSQGSLWPSSRA